MSWEGAHTEEQRPQQLGSFFLALCYIQATVLCDVIVLYCMKKRYYYREKKYKYVEDYEQVGCLLNSQQAGRPKRLTSPASCTSSENPVHLGVLSTQAVTHHSHHPLHFWTICTNICFMLFFRWTHPLKSSLILNSDVSG